jgi:F-type H+-transporting ATPase subunit c
MKKALLVSLLVILTMGVASVAFGQETADAKTAGLDFFIWTVITSGSCIAVAAFGGALGQSAAIKAACEGIARNPEASGKITVTMIIGLALIESLVIYALVICLIMLFANPATSKVLALMGLA